MSLCVCLLVCLFGWLLVCLFVCVCVFACLLLVVCLFGLRGGLFGLRGGLCGWLSELREVLFAWLFVIKGTPGSAVLCHCCCVI